MEKTFHTGAAECEARERRRYDSAGIARDYVNAAGKRESISDASRQKLYEAMSQERLDGDALSPVYVFRQRESYSVTINSPTYQWRLRPEDYADRSADGDGRYEGELLAPSLALSLMAVWPAAIIILPCGQALNSGIREL